MEPDVIAESSPAAQDPSARLAALPEAAYETWRATGALPSIAADSTPAEADAQPASTDATLPAASEPATPKKAKGIDARIQELLTERKADRDRIDRLERESAELRRGKPDATPAESSPAPAAEKLADHKRYMAMPDAPKVTDFADYEEFIAAQAVFVADKRHEERQATEREQQGHRSFLEQQTTRVNTFVEKLNAAKLSDPTFEQRIAPIAGLKTVAKALADGERLTVDHAIAEEIIDSSIPGELMIHLAEHPEALADLRAAKDKPDLQRRIGRLEGRLERDAPAASPPKKTVTSAPAPGAYLGTRPAVAADPVQRARETGDVGEYIRAANARDLAARRK